MNRALDEIVRRLRTHYRPQSIVLFGSYAWGTPEPDSDVDLLIIKETSEPFFHRMATVRRILADPESRVPLDIIVLTPSELAKRLAIGDQFIAQIIEKGRVLI